jgi:ankyrin repeat protein
MGLALSILGAAGSIYTYAAPSQQKMVKLVVEMSEEQAFFTVLEQGSSEGVSSLIENGFDVNQRLENGATPLFMAIFSVSTIGLRAVEIVKALIAHGARRDSTVEVDGRPVTPFTLVEILEEQLAAYAQTEGLPHDQHAAIGEIKQALSAIKALVRF